MLAGLCGAWGRRSIQPGGETDLFDAGAISGTEAGDADGVAG